MFHGRHVILKCETEEASLLLMCLNVNVRESTSHATHTDTDATHATGATPAADAATDDDTRQIPDITAYIIIPDIRDNESRLLEPSDRMDIAF
jgi:hypothetical protein